MDDIAEKIAKLDREIDSVHAEKATVSDQPAPPSEPAEAEVKAEETGN